MINILFILFQSPPQKRQNLKAEPTTTKPQQKDTFIICMLAQTEDPAHHHQATRNSHHNLQVSPKEETSYAAF